MFEGGFDAGAAAAVWAVEEAGGTLEELEQRSLVSFEPEAQRYHLHDLLRAVALEALARDPAREHDALRRHAGHFFAVLQAADALYRAGHDDVGRGLALLDAEMANIRAAQRWAAGAMVEDERAAELAQYFPNHNCLWVRLAPGELLAWLETSLAAAERRGDRAGQAAAAGNLGLIYRRRGELDRAEEMHRKSLAIEEELGRKEGMAADYGNLGSLYEQRGEMGQAVAYWRRSLALYRGIGARLEIEKVSGWLREAGVDPDRDEAAA